MSYLADQITQVLALDPGRPAILFKDEVWTWGDVGGLAQALKGKLDELGLAEADCVGLMLRNRPPQYSAILGVVMGERCVLTLNSLMPDDKLSQDIFEMRPKVVVGDPEDWARPGVVEAVRKLGAAGVQVSGDRAAPVSMVPGLETIGAGPFIEAKPGVAVLMLTSGTTGKPKRAPLGYRQLELNIKRAARADKTWKETDPPKLHDELVMLFTPLVHISGMYFVISNVIGGRTVRLLEKFSVEDWRKAVVEVRPKTAGGPPTALKMILEANVPKEDLSSLVALTCGTAGVSPDIVDEFVSRYGLPVLATYGATEFAGAVAGWSLANFHKYWATKRGAAGRMHPGVHARTVDPETGEPQPPGKPGVLELKSEVIGGGTDWVRTSDLAIVDEDHFLFILGRNDNAIIRGGFKVMPDQVVKALEAHPAIKEASVVGLPDPRLGAVPVAAYVLEDGAEDPGEAELSAFLRETLMPYQVPVKFRAVPELPRTPSLKVAMPAVRALFEAEAQPQG